MDEEEEKEQKEQYASPGRKENGAIRPPNVYWLGQASTVANRGGVYSSGDYSGIVVINRTGQWLAITGDGNTTFALVPAYMIVGVVIGPNKRGHIVAITSDFTSIAPPTAGEFIDPGIAGISDYGIWIGNLDLSQPFMVPIIAGNSGSFALDSTTAALAASANYTTQTPFGLANVRNIVGTVYADEAGTLEVQQSPDGTNWDAVTKLDVAASTPTSFSVDVVGQYGRLNYTNGATAQTTFRLYAWSKTI